MNIKSFLSLTVALAVVPAVQLTAQIVGRTVVLSPRVGDYVDVAERERFHLFLSVADFHGASVIQTADSGLVVVFDKLAKDGRATQEARRYPLRVLVAIGERIDHFEELVQGTYVMGTHPVQLYTLAGAPVTETASDPIAARPTADMTRMIGRDQWWNVWNRAAAGTPAPRFPLEYPQFGLSIGVGYHGLDDRPVWDLVDRMEGIYRATGYPISHHRRPEESPMTYVYGITLAISPVWRLSAEYSRTEGTIGCTGEAVTATYAPPLLDARWVRAVLSGGLQHWYIQVDQKLAYANQIGAADSAGRYLVLGGILIQASAPVTGGFVGIGAELGRCTEFSPGLMFSARYFFGPDVSIGSPAGPAVITTRAFIVSAAFTLYL